MGRYGSYHAQGALWDLVAQSALELHVCAADQLSRIEQLMRRYSDVPMDLADASLVAAAETLNQRLIFSLDKHFFVYRLHGIEAFQVLPAPG